MRDSEAMRASPQNHQPASRWWTLGGYHHDPQSLQTDRVDPALFTTMLTPSAPQVMAGAAA